MKNKNQKIITDFLMGLIVCVGLNVHTTHASAATYYVSPTGNDNDNGSIFSPWQTVRTSVGKLAAGDTLYLREGNYLENGISISNGGAAQAPITIRNYPGETPIIEDAQGLTPFRTVPNTAWTLYDSEKMIYRSSATFSDIGDGVMGYFKEGSDYYQLAAYTRWGDFFTDNENFISNDYIYVGPGVYYDLTSDYIYIRLKHSWLQSQINLPYPSNTDPGQTEIALYFLRDLITLMSGVSYINFEGLTLRTGGRAIYFGSNVNNINIQSSVIKGGRTSMWLDDYAHHIIFDGITMDGFMPEWVSFEDVKVNTATPDGISTPPAYMLKLGILNMQPNVNTIEIKNSTFQNTFDGIVGYAINNIHIHHNTMSGIRDDFMQIYTDAYNLEIDHNTYLASKGRILSRQEKGSPLYPGTKYIHHNVIEMTRKSLQGRPGSEIYQISGDGFLSGSPFGRHGAGTITGAGDPWKVYNNTIIMGAARNGNYARLGMSYEYNYNNFIAGNPQEVYNNIFVQTENQMISENVRVADGSQINDYNLYYRSAANLTEPMFNNFEDGALTQDFNSLAALKASQFFADSQLVYGPGIENSGIEADPMFDGEYRPAANGPAATGAIDLTSKGWPGTDGGTYRGALAPAQTQDTERPMVNILSPTSASVYNTNESIITVSGSASDNVGLESISWSNDRGGSGLATGLEIWNIPSIILLPGDNLVTITARDTAGNTEIDTLMVTYTPPLAPTVTTASATNISATSGTLNGNVNPHGLSTTAWFEYGTSSGTYSDRTVDQILTGTNAVSVSANLTGLTLGITYYYRIVGQNSAGTSSGSEMSFTTLDTIVPAGSISINSGAAYTNTTAVTLALSATDNVGVTGYYLSTSSTVPLASASGWTSVSSTPTYNATVSSTLSSGDGSKTIYVWYKDAAMNVSNTASDSITLDTTVPEITITIPTSNATYRSATRSITLGGSASDAASGISNVTWSNNRGGSGNATGTTSWSIVDINLSRGNNVITVTARDTAGNTATDTLRVSY